MLNALTVIINWQLGGYIIPSRYCLLYKYATKIIHDTRAFINDTKISEIRGAGDSNNN